MDGFSPLTQEEVGWYVYLLRDPRNGEVFYVGKGQGNRAFAHAASARDTADHPELQTAKAARITEITQSAPGVNVHVEILRHRLVSEGFAYEVESATIDVLHATAPGTLLNCVRGHGHEARGWVTAEEIEIFYAAAEAPPLEVPVLLVSLNKLWRPEMSAEALEEITCRWWHSRGPRRDAVRYVFGVHRGIIRSVYRPVNWRQRTEGDRGWEEDKPGTVRWGCDGEEAPEMKHYLRTSIARYLPQPGQQQQWSFRYAGPAGSV